AKSYPFAAATNASPIPVFPLVGSIMVSPGFNTPSSSACSTIAKAIRSLTELPGLKYSNLTYTSALFSSTVRFNFTIGVSQINCVIISTILMYAPPKSDYFYKIYLLYTLQKVICQFIFVFFLYIIHIIYALFNKIKT